jgi:site-specific recombinase XerD
MASVLPLTLAQAIELFLQEEQALGRGPQTLDWHKRGLKHLQQYLTRRNLSLLRSVTEVEVRGWLAFLRAEPSATGTIRTANTVMTAARSAHAFYAWAVRQGYLARTPFVRGMVPWYRSRQSNWQSIQLSEPACFAQLLHACRPPGSKGEEEDHATARNRAMLWMMLEMGLLVSEVCALHLGDVDERLQVLHIQGRGARERWLPLKENTQRALRTYLRKPRVRMEKHGEHDPLFLSERCKPMTPNLITQLFHRLSLRAGMTEQWMTPSILHDTFAVSVKRYQDYCKHADSPSEKKRG